VRLSQLRSRVLLHAKRRLLGIVIGELRSTTTLEATGPLDHPIAPALPSTSWRAWTFVLPRLTTWDRPLWVGAIQTRFRAPSSPTPRTASLVTSLTRSLSRFAHAAAILHPDFRPPLCSYAAVDDHRPPCRRSLTYRFEALLHVIGQLPLLAHPLHHPPSALLLCSKAAPRPRRRASCLVDPLALQHGLCFSATAARAQ
jgi:hypothetical protein